MGKFDLYKLTYTLIFITLFSGCNLNEPDPYLNPEITIENNKITSRYCLGFGSKILTDRDQVLIRGGNSIFIFKIGGSKIELIQTIDFNLSTSITGMTVNNSTLAFCASEKETNVFIYERLGESWVFKQEIKGTTGETFGISIDIDENYMIIGAPAISSYHGGHENGKVYIYHKTNKGWMEESDFQAPLPSSADEFGRCVAIHNNLILAGSVWMEEIPVYKYDDTLSLLKIDTTVKMLTYLTHHKNNFMVFDDWNDQIRSFKLESNGDFIYRTVDCDFDGKLGLDGFGCLAIRDSFSLVSTSRFCYFLEFVNNKWSEKMTVSPDIEDPYYVQGLAISDDYIILGGPSITSDYSYVSFISY